MIEPKKPLKKKDQIKFHEEEALKLQAKLQAQEQHELTIEKKSTLFQQLLKKRRKFFATKRAETKRNRPPIRAQQRSIIYERVNTFVDMDTKVVEGSKVRAKGSETREESSSKKARDELEQEKAKKQKVDDDQEAAKMKELMKIVPDEEEVAVDAIPLATKPPSIVDYKIIKEGKISYYQIIRADGSSKRPEEGYERVLWGDLNTMFEHHVEDLGRIVRIKRLLDDLEVTAAQVRVTAAKHKLVLLVILMKNMLSINSAGTKVTTASVQS
ncbi:hypothetical protein Tco_1393589 [Tanacetum coccineum]